MRARVLGGLFLALSPAILALSGCATRSGSLRALAYRLPDPPAATYSVVDTVRVDFDALGQSVALQAASRALYGLAFERAGEGLRVRVDVRDLEAEVSVPVAEPIRVDEGIIDGEIVVVLDRRGGLTVLEAPEIEQAAAPFFAGPTIARSLFPGLPGRATSEGERWADTVAYAADADTGGSSGRSVLAYTVVGEVTMEGHRLLEVVFEGTTEMRQTVAIQGVGIEQTTDLAVRGRLLWDLERGLVRERETRSEGTGSVKIALAPAPLPTRVTMIHRVRLEEP
jgi:hypothetical protein